MKEYVINAEDNSKIIIRTGVSVGNEYTLYVNSLGELVSKPEVEELPEMSNDLALQA